MKAYRRWRGVTVAVMRKCGMGETVRLRWRDYRSSFPWENQARIPADTVDILRWME